MSPLIFATFIFSIGLGTTITLTSSHWLLAWIGLEINTLAIIPLITQKHHPRAVEAATKYFLTQAAAAAILLFASTINAWLTGQWDIQQQIHSFPQTLIIIALALKIGLAPLHSWIPEVLQGLELSIGLILSTWQKIAPFYLLLQLQPSNHPLLLILGLASTLIGGWGGINQIQLRKILAYSSIAHLGWILLIIQFSPSLSLLTLLTYFLITFSAFLLFKLKKVYNINQLATTWNKFPALTAITPLILLSLGGLPPLTGFMPKWLILQELTTQTLAPLATLAAITALLSLYFYLRLSYAIALTIFPNNMVSLAPWRLPSSPKNSTLIACTTTATLLLLPLTPTAIMLVFP